MPQTPLDDCWRGLINILAAHFGGHGVPSVKTAIEKAGDQAVKAVTNHPDYKVIQDAGISILWVNPFVTPEIFFCLQDATEQKYDDYFSPIILTTDADEKAVIDEIHTKFHEYYKKDKNERIKDMLTLTDLKIGDIGHLTIINNGSVNEFKLNGKVDASKESLFQAYVSLVTNNGKWRYVVFRAGLGGAEGAEIEMGRVYVGLKACNGNNVNIDDGTKKAIKRLCFDMLSAFVLAGVMQRNRIVLAMLGDFSRLMRTFDDHVIRHRDVLVNLGMSGEEGRRLEVKRLFDEMSGESAKWKSSSDYTSHLTCQTCSKFNEDLAHAIDRCSAEGLFLLFMGKLKLLLSACLTRQYPAANLPSRWSEAIYVMYAARKKHISCGIVDAQRNVPSLVAGLPIVLSDQRLDCMLKTLLLLLSCDDNNGHVKSNLDKILKNEWSKNSGEYSIKYLGEGVCTISVSWAISGKLIKGAFTDDANNIKIDISRIKNGSLTNVLAFATLFFSSIYFVVRTAVDRSEIKASYSFSGDGIKDKLPASRGGNCTEYLLVLKP